MSQSVEKTYWRAILTKLLVTCVLHATCIAKQTVVPVNSMMDIAQ